MPLAGVLLIHTGIPNHLHYDVSSMKDTSDQGASKLSILEAYQSNLSGLKRFLSRMLSNPHDVEDVVQETFIRAHLAERNSQIKQPKSYLFKIARNVALNQFRQDMRKPTDFIEDYHPSSVSLHEGTLEDEVLAQEKFEILCGAIATLPPQCRKVYLMRRVYGMSYKDIASALHLSVKTIEKHLRKGYARCDDYMDERLGTECQGARSAQQRKGGR